APAKDAGIGFEPGALLARRSQLGAPGQRARDERLLRPSGNARLLVRFGGERLVRRSADGDGEAGRGARALGVRGGTLLLGARRLELREAPVERADLAGPRAAARRLAQPGGPRERCRTAAHAAGR